MSRQSITFTEPNDKWLKGQVDSKEYASKSEVLNDLIRQVRKQQSEIDWIRVKLEQAEESGYSTRTKDEILKDARSIIDE